MFCMFYMVYHLYISNAPAPKTVHSKSNTTTKIAAPNFMRVFYHKSPPSAYPPTTGGRSREIRLSRSDQVARRATRGALRSKVARGRAGAMRGANPLPAVSHRRNRRSASRQTFRIVWITRKAGEPCRSGDVEKKPSRTWRSCRSKEPQADESYTVDLLQKSPTLFR